MTYNVFSGMLNLTQPSQPSTTRIFFFSTFYVYMCMCVNRCVAGSGDDQLSDELMSALSHRHLLEFIVERCSDVAPRFLLCDASCCVVDILTASLPACYSLCLFLSAIMCPTTFHAYVCCNQFMNYCTVQPLLCTTVEIFFNIRYI